MNAGRIRYATNSFSWHPRFNKSIGELADEQIIAQVAQAGAEGIEMEPERVTAHTLAQYGVTLSGASIGGASGKSWLAPDWRNEYSEEVVGRAAAVADLGGDYIFVGLDMSEAPSVTQDVLESAAKRLDEVGRRTKQFGVELLVHNHANVPEGLAAELAWINYTDRECVGAFLDIGWAYTAGADPVALVYELGSRLRGFHFRNQVGAVPTQTLAEGDLDIAAVATAIKDIGYRGWVSLELWHRKDTEVTKSMLECQKESLAYMRQLLSQ